MLHILDGLMPTIVSMPDITEEISISNKSLKERHMIELASKLKDNFVTTELSMAHIFLDKCTLQHLISAIQSNTNVLAVLHLLCLKINNSDCQQLSKMLASNTTLTTLHLNYNRLTEVEIYDLAKGLKDNNTLVELDLSGNKICDPGMVHLTEALQFNSTLESLMLVAVDIGTKGAKHLTDLLQSNSSLKTLLLDGNVEIKDDGAKHLATALRQNTTLEYLALAGTGIGNDGANALMESFKLNPALDMMNLRHNGATMACYDVVLSELTLLEERNRNNKKQKNTTLFSIVYPAVVSLD